MVEARARRRSTSRTARRILDEDHYGLEKVKRRILEFLAVRKLNPQGRARSCASSARPASARPRSARASRGRRAASSCASAWAACMTRRRSAATGALISAPCPATIIQATAQGRHAQPGDDAGRDRQARPRLPRRSRRRRCWRCSTRSRTTPSATTTWACRSTFSSVMFIATANVLDTIPGPLRDRMEVIEPARLHRGGEGRDRASAIWSTAS